MSDHGRLNEAEEKYKEALEIVQLPEIWNNLGNVYKRKGLLYKAIESYQRALEMDPKYPTARANLGIAFMDLGRYAEAIMILEKVIESGYESDEVYLALAISYEKSGKTADFVRVYSKVKRKDKDEILKSYGVEPPSG